MLLKKIISLGLVLILLAGISACSSSSTSDDETTVPTTKATTASTTASTAASTVASTAAPFSTSKATASPLPVAAARCRAVLPSGLYFVRLDAAEQVSTRKIMLIKALDNYHLQIEDQQVLLKTQVLIEKYLMRILMVY